MICYPKCLVTPAALLVFLAACSRIDRSWAFTPSPLSLAHQGQVVRAGPSIRNINAELGAAPVQSSTALSANLLDRVVRVAKGNVNNVLKYMEDPEKIMNQALDDMQTDLMKVRVSYAEITGTQRRLLKQKEMANRLAEDWYARAQLALRQGNEGLAKQALTQRQVHVETMKGLEAQLNSQTAAIDRLYDGMQELESRILEAKAKKEQMVARARTAKSTQQVNDMLTGITGKTSMDAFKRMEDKVEALEAAAEVSSELNVFGLPQASSGQVEKEFQRLEASSEVDDELKKMKRNLLSGAAEPNKNVRKIPITVSLDVDSALKKLKQEAGI